MKGLKALFVICAMSLLAGKRAFILLILMNRLFLAMLAGASVVAAQLAMQPAHAEELSLREAGAIKKGCFSGAGQAQVDACTRMIQSKYFVEGALTDAYFSRADAYSHLRQYQRAVEDFTQAVTRKPDFTAAYNGRANAHLFLQQFQPAIQDYTKVMALDPKPAAGYFNARGAAYTEVGQYKDAISDFNKAIALAPTPTSYNNRGYCYLLLKQFKQAIDDYDRAIAMAPNSAAVLYMRGIAKLRSDDKPGGNADIAAAVALEPKIAEEFAAAGVKP